MSVGATTGLRYAHVPAIDPKFAQVVGQFWWPMERLGEGLQALASRAGLCQKLSSQSEGPPLVPEQLATEDLGGWLEWAAQRIGIEAEPVDAAVPDLTALLRAGGPALISYRTARGPGFLLLLGSQRSHLRMLAPDLKARSCNTELMRTALCWHHEAPLVPEVQRLLDTAGIQGSGRSKVQAAMLRERLARERIGSIWLLRLPASTGFWHQLVHARIPRRVGLILVIFAAVYGLEIAGWSLIGDAVLNGRLDWGWLAAWLLLALTIIPLRLLGTWFEATFALDAGRLLKSRLLSGALGMDLESVRVQGVGHLLGRVMESQALESLALNGGIAVLVSMLELGLAAFILGAAAGSMTLLALLLVWLAVTAGLGWHYYRRMAAWSMHRLDMTHELIEHMTGHRTRLAQERPGRRDAHEDGQIQAYLGLSRAMDEASVPMLAGVPAGWMLLGLSGLVPSFVTGSTWSASAMAISVGGIMLAQRAFTGVSGGLAGLARAAIAWRQVANLFGTINSAETAPALWTAPTTRSSEPQGLLVDAHNLHFKYQADGERVLSGVKLGIAHGERVLLLGASGGGKSTLASILTGLRLPQSGLLLLNGLDRHTLGGSWHRLATEAPQFHENHILSGTLGFNLLMGREWPATQEDLQEAEQLCEELGLDDLLRRMPAGMMQAVGETGWQLSHGERSRIFLARALLQNAELTIMDESFAALDPQTLQKCLDCALRRARTLVVIAHP